MSDQSILITGGAGFIGTRLVQALLKAEPKRRIWILDNLHSQVHGPDAGPPMFPDGVEFVRGDVVDQKSLQDVVQRAKPEIIYHLAAETGTGQSSDEPTRYCNVNILGTTNLIESLRNIGTPRRVILAASRAVYGEGAYRDALGVEYAGLPRRAEQMSIGDFSAPLPPGASLPSTATKSHAGLPPAPASVYASTKLMQEYLLTQSGEVANWDATILRFQNVYGPGQSLRNPYTGVLSIFARQLLAGNTLNIFEDGKIARDFVFVDDVVDALVLAGETSISHGTILDIGSGLAVPILDVARTLMRALGRQEDAFRISGEYRVGDIRHACADIESATKLLGWMPRIGIEEGLERLALWARKEFQSVTVEQTNHK